MRADFVLSSFPVERREQLRGLPSDQMAAEVLEDTAAKWAARRLANAPSGPEGIAVEEEVVRVLLRSLQVTQAAERLARKLAQFLRDVAMPASRVQRIQEELHWVTVPPKEKSERLLQLDQFDRS